MKNQHSRILAWLLVFSMVLAMMPAMLITASADEPVSAATWAKQIEGHQVDGYRRHHDDAR